MNDFRVLLDFPPSAVPDARTTRRRLSFAAPGEIIEARAPEEVRPALRRVQRLARDGAWAAGFVAYEAAPAFDSAFAIRPHEGPAPLLWFGIFDEPAESPAAPEPHQAEGAGAGPAGARATGIGPTGTDDVTSVIDWRVDESRDGYDRTVAGIRANIAAGDVYQVNYALRLRAAWNARPTAFYESIAASRQGLYHALIRTPGWSIVSASPELFLDAEGGTLTTRPMKGTHRRGRWSGEDRAHAATLAASPKDRAENLMIVDLLRNDFGRIAVPGSVRVPSMFDIETYPTVHQMTSTITAVPHDDLSLDDIFAATFPCGSVTGAPKIAAMRQIATVESSPRGPYCGAIGVVRPDGSFTFNVAIRTLLIDHSTGTAVYGAGGGITWDSNAPAEYDELVSKAALLVDSVPHFDVLETLRLDHGRYPRFDLHLDRLSDSGAYWGFDSNLRDRARTALAREALLAPAGVWRVRLTADRHARISIERTPLDEPEFIDEPTLLDNGRQPGSPPARHGGPPCVRFARSAVSSNDRLLFHKTTARDVYDRHRADEPDAYDVLLWNERGEVTEFTTGNVVARIDGVLCTPPRSAGLLAGTMREQLLRAGTIAERAITVDQLRRAPEIWFLNSVRGCVRVTLAYECTKPPRPRTAEEAS